MPNRLAKEKSPYLLQHKDNPVNWYPWGNEAFEKSRTENKLIFLSIGYSTCYWCHVMEKDSFENEKVAEYLNLHFVSIKVDREERPDVDKIYMDAVMAMTGHGGWPMSVFLSPDLKPVYGGTFYYESQFVSLLERLAALWSGDQAPLLQNAEALTSFLRREGKESAEKTEAGLPTEDVLHLAFKELENSFDQSFGGFGGAPKFPPTERILFLLRYYVRFKNENALRMARETLAAMAKGGMYDQLAGGFHRYSTDEKWLIPHFEKMLYDNAQLVVAYLEAFQLTGDELFSSVARETLDYVLREMTAPEGGFYSAEDAGEVGREGEFYVWTLKEIKELLSADEFAALTAVYEITEAGNFEHNTNALAIRSGSSWSDRSGSLLLSAAEKLRSARSDRNLPLRDDKILTSWNALMISAFAKGYQVLRDKKYLTAAERAAEFIQSKLCNDSDLFRRFRDGESGKSALLDDYAYLIQALVTLYESDFDTKWFQLALELQKQQDLLFWDEQNGGYFYSRSTDPSLIVRQKEFVDEAIPAANSIAALNLLRFADFTGESEYRDRAGTLLNLSFGEVSRMPSAFASNLVSLDYFFGPSKQVGITGFRHSKNGDDFCDFCWKTFLPNKVLAWKTPNEVTPIGFLQAKEQAKELAMFYICENQACKLPTTDVDEAKRLIPN